MELSLWARFFLVLLLFQLVVRPLYVARAGTCSAPRLRVTFDCCAGPGGSSATFRDLAIAEHRRHELAGWSVPGSDGWVIVLLHGRRSATGWR